VVWGMPTPLRIFGVAAGIVLELVVIFGVAQAPDSPIAWAFLVGLTLLATFNTAITRRSCVIDNGQLIAKGRFATRKVDLRDLRQAAVGLGQGLWIQTHHPLDRRGGDVLCLRMIPSSKITPTGSLGGDQAVRLIRARAKVAGAQLDPPARNPTKAPTSKALLFSI
jgi:hypothetical protein